MPVLARDAASRPDHPHHQYRHQASRRRPARLRQLLPLRNRVQPDPGYGGTAVPARIPHRPRPARCRHPAAARTAAASASKPSIPITGTFPVMIIYASIPAFPLSTASGSSSRSSAGPPRLRDPAAADRWTWLVIAAWNQLWLARPLAADVRLPWQPAVPAGEMTPGRVRAAFRCARETAGTPASPPKPASPGPGRPKGSKNKNKPPRHPVGKRNRKHPNRHTKRQQVK